MRDQRVSSDLQTVEPIDLASVLEDESDAEYWRVAADRARVVETASRLFGRKVAKSLWTELGLPLVGRNPGTPDSALTGQVAAFIDVCCQVDPTGQLPASKLHGAYQQWGPRCGAPPLSMTMLGRCMTQIPVRKTKGRIVTYGLRLT